MQFFIRNLPINVHIVLVHFLNLFQVHSINNRSGHGVVQHIKLLPNTLVSHMNVIQVQVTPLIWKQNYRQERSACWFTPRMATMADSGPGWSQKPGTLSRSPILVAGAQDYWVILCCPHRNISRELGCKKSTWDSNLKGRETQREIFYPHLKCLHKPGMN